MSVAIRHDDLRRRNRSLLIGAIRRAGSLSRTALATSTGLSHSTISAISADLIAEGILRESNGSADNGSRRGRPQVGIEIAPEAASVVAAVLSLNSISGAVIDYAGNIVVQESRRIPTLTAGRDELCTSILEFIFSLLDRSGRSASLKRIVLATQGTTDAEGRTLVWSPITPHSDLPFAALIHDRFKVPVTVQNDCNMMAEALRWLDPTRYRNDFIALLISNGIGMGLMSKGGLFVGTRSSASEFGHMNHRPGGALCRCGRNGCIEAYAGNYAIWRRAHGLPEDTPPVADVDDAEMEAIAERARRADGPERQAFAQAGEAIGYGLGSLFALIDPAPVAFIGWGARHFDLLEPSMKQALAQTAGGQHNTAPTYETIAQEVPIIEKGCAMLALTWIDREVYATSDQSSRIA
ncbi:MAG: ROK family protein [Rhizobiaceae bacterium]|nr:ROK family protein [Rhizobiaceae bacterium]